MKALKQITVVLMIVFVLAVSMPLSAFADPVSASIAANAFAQAITAYGAANGVSMTFDNITDSNTSDIGENVHTLWEQYREFESTSDDFNDVAADFVATNAFVKSNQYIAGQWLDVVGINISDDIMPAIDGFWNWLLSGPAQMVKVDNAYVWNETNGQILPVPVIYTQTTTINGHEVSYFPVRYSYDLYYNGSYQTTRTIVLSGNQPFYAYASKSGNYLTVSVLSFNGEQSFTYTETQNGNDTVGTRTTYNQNNGYYKNDMPDLIIYDNPKPTGNSGVLKEFNIPMYSSTNPATNFGSLTNDSVQTNNDIDVGIMPYVGDAVARNPSFPDTDDDDYTPLPAGIPTNIPWDNTKYGDGTGALTNEQLGDIVGDMDKSITDNPAKTLELADTATPPSPEPPASEVYIPLLPVTLPHFEFNLSGIWHYVTDWVASIGSWMSMMFTIWANLPFAMVLPVYATAVIVIVLGVYKRFFM